MAGAGERDQLVQFYPITVGEDAAGLETETDGTPVPAWAKVLYGTGAERREAGAAGSHQAATFIVDTCASLRAATARWEIDHAGARWGVTSMIPAGIAQRELHVTAVRKGA